MQPSPPPAHRVGVIAGWEEVYASDYRRLVALVAAVCGSLAEAEEAVQEAFVRALGVTGRRPVVQDPQAWLYRVAVNVARARWRRRVLGGRLTRLFATDAAGPPAASPDTRLALLAALKRLPFAQREAVALHYFADLSIEDIAARVDAPPGTIKARLSRGRDALARLLSDEVPVGGRRA
jgi:RNA polymerase sigma-70 factor (ECF subfamily)